MDEATQQRILENLEQEKTLNEALEKANSAPEEITSELLDKILKIENNELETEEIPKIIIQAFKMKPELATEQLLDKVLKNEELDASDRSEIIIQAFKMKPELATEQFLSDLLIQKYDDVKPQEKFPVIITALAQNKTLLQTAFGERNFTNHDIKMYLCSTLKTSPEIVPLELITASLNHPNITVTKKQEILKATLEHKDNINKEDLAKELLEHATHRNSLDYLLINDILTEYPELATENFIDTIFNSQAHFYNQKNVAATTLTHNPELLDKILGYKYDLDTRDINEIVAVASRKEPELLEQVLNHEHLNIKDKEFIAKDALTEKPNLLDQIINNDAINTRNKNYIISQSLAKNPELLNDILDHQDLDTEQKGVIIYKAFIKHHNNFNDPKYIEAILDSELYPEAIYNALEQTLKNSPEIATEKLLKKVLESDSLVDKEVSYFMQDDAVISLYNTNKELSIKDVLENLGPREGESVDLLLERFESTFEEKPLEKEIAAILNEETISDTNKLHFLKLTSRTMNSRFPEEMRKKIYSSLSKNEEEQKQLIREAANHLDPELKGPQKEREQPEAGPSAAPSSLSPKAKEELKEASIAFRENRPQSPQNQRSQTPQRSRSPGSFFLK